MHNQHGKVILRLGAQFIWKMYNYVMKVHVMLIIFDNFLLGAFDILQSWHGTRITNRKHGYKIKSAKIRARRD